MFTPLTSNWIEKATPHTSHDLCATEQIFHPRKPLAPVTKRRFPFLFFIRFMILLINSILKSCAYQVLSGQIV